MKLSEIDEITKSYILLPFIEQAVCGIRHKRSGVDEILVPCPFCGEKRLKGTIFRANTGRICYRCWKANCECHEHAVVAEKWLKTTDIGIFNNYIAELKKELVGPAKEKLRERAAKARIEAEKKAEEERQARIKADLEATKFFKPISKPGKWQKAALLFCKKRMIPVDIAKRFYYADEGKYEGRVIIPFWNKNNKIEFFQGRDLRPDSEIRYMSKVGSTALYNWDFLDKTKPVIVLEGPIDSMFVENATATVGAGSSGLLDSKLDELSSVYYLYDSDEAGIKAGGLKVREHKYAFMWTKFKNDYALPDHIKDMNDAYMHLHRTTKFTFEELQPFFTNILDEFIAFA